MWVILCSNNFLFSIQDIEVLKYIVTKTTSSPISPNIFSRVFSPPRFLSHSNELSFCKAWNNLYNSWMSVFMIWPLMILMVLMTLDTSFVMSFPVVPQRSTPLFRAVICIVFVLHPSLLHMKLNYGNYKTHYSAGLKTTQCSVLSKIITTHSLEPFSRKKYINRPYNKLYL